VRALQCPTFRWADRRRERRHGTGKRAVLALPRAPQPTAYAERQMAMRVGPALALTMCAAIALPSCSSGSSRASHPTAVSTRQSPGPHRVSQITTCGSSGLRATRGKQTWSLLSCAGLADVNPLPSARLLPGDVVTFVNGVGPRDIALHGGDVVAIDGLHLVARHAGSTLVTVTHWPWCFVLKGPPPKACPLMRITVS
jgi:hypothetical protein